MAYHHHLSWGCASINSSIDRPEVAIKWGVRSLYLVLFLSLMIVLNLWEFPITLPYIGAIVSLILTALFVVNNEAWDELDDMYIEDISGFDSSTDV